MLILKKKFQVAEPEGLTHTSQLFFISIKKYFNSSTAFAVGAHIIHRNYPLWVVVAMYDVGDNRMGNYIRPKIQIDLKLPFLVWPWD